MLVRFLAGGVVRADFLADITAVYVFGFGDFLGEVGRNLVFVFDCEVGDAEARVDDAGGDYGAGGASVDAFGAVAADFGGAVLVDVPAVMFWRVVELEGGDDFGEKDPGAVVAGDQAGIFADDAEAGLFGEGAFEEGAGVDVAFVLMVGGEGLEEGFELLEFFGDNLVIVASIGVAGDAAVVSG